MLNLAAKSQEIAMLSMERSRLSPWIGGLPFSTYTDCYDSATGELKLFMNKKDTNIAGRIVLDRDGRECKMYNAFIDLLIGINGVGFEPIKRPDGTTFLFKFIKGAKFGIKAIRTEEDSDFPKPEGGFYKEIKHELIRA